MVIVFVGLFSPLVAAQVGNRLFFEGEDISPEVLTVLKQSCQECHSDGGRLRSTSKLPAVAGQLTGETENIGFLNFSRWGQYKKRDRRGYLLAIASAVSSGLMPPAKGRRFGRQRSLTEVEKKLIANWAIVQAKQYRP